MNFESGVVKLHLGHDNSVVTPQEARYEQRTVLMKIAHFSRFDKSAFYRL